MSRCHHREEADPAGRPTLSLEPEALFVVGALRSWTADRRRGRPEGVPAWRGVFGMAGLPEAAAGAFDAFLRAVERGMRRPLDIRCCRCPAVGRDEEAMLRLLQALQQDDRLGAFEALEDWLVPEAVAPALALAGALARLLAAGFVRIEDAAPGRGPSPGAVVH